MGVGTPAPLRRVGLFGGAFDPPHDAHLALARTAIDALQLDQLLVVPTGDAWHKSRPLSPATDRLAMCQLAFQSVPQVRVDDRELRREGATYTIDTLTELRAGSPGAELFLLIGADQAAAFHSWRQAQDIVRIAIVTIAGRADSAGAAMPFDSDNPLPGLHVPAGRVRLLSLPLQSHSATDVRRRVAAGLRIDHLVAPAVAGYIAHHHLYQTV
ncbi:MAG: nicotinate-nucleotide adenylyltransferase [Ottowia sp.]|nr:nicotinate-nucleotide adenylyltransferase [Ottowia sp.]